MTVKVGKNEERAADDAHRTANLRRTARAEAERTREEVHAHVQIAAFEAEEADERAEAPIIE